jgi:hypothetical protein
MRTYGGFSGFGYSGVMWGLVVRLASGWVDLFYCVWFKIVGMCEVVQE